MDTPQYVAEVARRVAEAIEAGGQSQLRIAEATGIPRTTLIRRLSGTSSFTVAELSSIASVLGVDLGAFMPPSERVVA